ncbi:Fe(2+) transport protein A/Fe(2+) transporter FeoB fusion protein [Desulfarculales bacterium]
MSAMNKSLITVALAGNPNAGKTSLFNALTGARQHVGNYPGVTVDKKVGEARLDGQAVTVVDLPGTYSLTAYSLEELVARNYLIDDRPNVVVDVVDASNLERNLYLAVQLMELGVPLVIGLNMVDVAEQRGMKIDPTKLSAMMGVPVVPTVARRGQGVEELLRQAVDLAAQHPQWKPLNISYGADVDQGLSELATFLEGATPYQGLFSTRWLALKCLEGDSEILSRVREGPALAGQILPVCQRVSEHMRSTLDDEPESVIADYRYGFISSITRQALVLEREVRMDFSDKMDLVLTNRLIGPLFLLGVLYGVYQFVFWGSKTPVEWFEQIFGRLGGAVESALPEGMLRSLIVSGVIDGVGGVLGFVPLIMFMFFAIAIMEDSGYMARIAYLMDRPLRAFGLHGNSVISLIVGGGISGGCAVPAVMAARTLKGPQARLATILVVPFMNCGAKLPVYSLLISAFFAHHQADVMFVLTIISWGIALLEARLLRSSLLKGSQSPFVMELPPYRTPTFKGLMIHTWERTWQYVKKAGTILLAVSLVVWALMSFPGLSDEEARRFERLTAQAQSDEDRKEVANERAAAGLGATVAGRLGHALTVVADPLGFDWRTNVALVGGLAAKEVIVSTMGTAYSLGQGAKKSADVEPLAKRLRASPGWTPLGAFALMIFVMIYSPCVATLAVIRRETGSWRWPLFAILHHTLMAYLLALLVYQGGRLLGLG